MIEVMKFDGFW